MFNKLYGVQDKNGNWRIRPEYNRIQIFSTGIILAKRVNIWILHTPEKSAQGHKVFDDAGQISENLCWVRANGKTGFLNQKGEIAVPLQYDEARDMLQGMAAVKKDGLWGFIDAQGRQLQPHVFTGLSSNDDGSYAVYEGTRAGLVKTDGSYLPTESETLPAEKSEQ